jgi:hypothetical protein
MIIKAGNIVSHTGAVKWGAGKVLEVTATMATIQFSDGQSRKIAASHFITLVPAAAASFVPPPEVAPAPQILKSSRSAKKKK